MEADSPGKRLRIIRRYWCDEEGTEAPEASPAPLVRLAKSRPLGLAPKGKKAGIKISAVEIYNFLPDKIMAQGSGRTKAELKKSQRPAASGCLGGSVVV